MYAIRSYYDGTTFIDQLVRYGNLVKTQHTKTLFDMDTSYQEAQKKPDILPSEEWPPLVRLNKERELIGVYLSSHPLDTYKLEMDNFTNCTLAEFEQMDSLKNRDLAIAGLVTEVRHLTTKTGKPFGTLTIEDYSGTFKFMLFGKDYEEYRQYLYDGYSLLIKGNVQTNPWRKDQEVWEFKIKSMVVLNNARESIVKSLSIRMSLADLNDEFVEEIKQQAAQNPGKATIKFTIIDREEGIAIDLFSRNTSVSVSNDLIDFLEARPELEYKVS